MTSRICATSWSLPAGPISIPNHDAVPWNLIDYHPIEIDGDQSKIGVIVSRLSDYRIPPPRAAQREQGTV